MMSRPETWMVHIILLSVLVLPVCAEEVLLSTQQPLSLGNNTTLVIEDVNPVQEVVWLKLYGRNETIGSAVISLGDHISYNDTNLTLYRIYSGGNNDLVAFLMGDGTAVHAHSVSDRHSVSDSSSGKINSSLSA